MRSCFPAPCHLALPRLMAEDYHTGLDLQRTPLAEAKQFASRPFKSWEITTWKYRGMNTHLWEVHVSISRGTSQLAARQSTLLGKVEIRFIFRCVITVHDKGIFITSFNPNIYLHPRSTALLTQGIQAHSSFRQQ